MREESKLLQKVDPQKNPELVIGAIKALQDYEIEEYERLDAIRRALQIGKPVKKDEIRRLGALYEKLQYEAEYQGKVEWTLDVIKRLQESKIGNSARLDTIKTHLEDGRTVDREEINYLKEKWKQLRMMIS